MAVSILSLFQCHVPYLAKNTYEELKVGMTVNDVMSSVNNGLIKPTLCSWSYDGNNENISSNSNECAIPKGIEINDRVTELTILYMGPGFLHNDFDVIFNSGAVINVTEFRQWD